MVSKREHLKRKLNQVLRSDYGMDETNAMKKLVALVNYYADETMTAEIVSNYEMLNEWLLRMEELEQWDMFSYYDFEDWTYERNVSDLKKINMNALVQYVKKKAADAGDLLMLIEDSRSHVFGITEMICQEKNGRLKWLDASCVCEHFSESVLEKYPDIEFTLCDTPEENYFWWIPENLRDKKNVIINKTSTKAISYESEFDIVTVFGRHECYDIETREIAVNNCYRALKEGGSFIISDIIRLSTEESENMALKRFIVRCGVRMESLKVLQEERRVKKSPITVEQHFEMLKKAGFRSVDIIKATDKDACFWAIK